MATNQPQLGDGTNASVHHAAQEEAHFATPSTTPQSAMTSLVPPPTAPQNIRDEIEISAVKLPPFWTNSPSTWFIQAEAQFENAGTKTERTKYAHLLTAMPPETLEKVIDIVQNPPAHNRYTHLKEALLTRLSISEEQRISKLLYNAEMGDSSPSEFHRRLVQLAGSSSDISDKLIFRLWLGRLPKSIEIAMISLGKTNLKEILPIADKIWEASKGAMGNACSVKQESSNENSEVFALKKEVQELKGLMEQMRISRFS